MEAAEILDRARSDEDSPQGWLVLPLLKRKVQTGIVGWATGIIVGFGLFVFIAIDTIPYNYQQGAFAGCLSTALLLMTFFIGAGSAWSIIADVRRLRQADRHLIVITPDDFVKQEGEKIVHVPLTHVRYVTARGVPPPDRSTSGANAIREIPSAGENITGFLFGRGFSSSGQRRRRKRMRTPNTLAFLDTRTDTEVIVVSDGSYGDVFEIAAYLKQYAARVQQFVDRR
ncbi:MAG TPA: hypothetical protein VKR83_07085 [Ktedonobacteraceae bacterium]|nr:hypothetical protein [Ktedonobacteraceae bacterium]